MPRQPRALAATLAETLGLELQPSKMMAELRVAGGDKGRAVKSLMRRPPMAGTRPVFIGDDTTDEPAFVAARELGGERILVGAPRESEAYFGIESPAALRGWLQAVAQ
nr:trehalose-phosphatase [Sandaracinobacteroides hominis]